MIVLGIAPFGQHPAACLLVDGKLTAFAEEERFIRLKGAFGRFPIRAVSWCLSQVKLPLSAVDRIGVGWDAEKYRFFMPAFFLRQWLLYGRKARGPAYGRIWSELVDQRPESIRYRMEMAIRSAGYRDRIPAVEFVSHHLAHAASSYYASGFDEA